MQEYTCDCGNSVLIDFEHGQKEKRCGKCLAWHRITSNMEQVKNQLLYQVSRKLFDPVVIYHYKENA